MRTTWKGFRAFICLLFLSYYVTSKREHGVYINPLFVGVLHSFHRPTPSTRSPVSVCADALTHREVPALTLRSQHTLYYKTEKRTGHTYVHTSQKTCYERATRTNGASLCSLIPSLSTRQSTRTYKKKLKIVDQDDISWIRIPVASHTNTRATRSAPDKLLYTNEHHIYPIGSHATRQPKNSRPVTVLWSFAQGMLTKTLAVLVAAAAAELVAFFDARGKLSTPA